MVKKIDIWDIEKLENDPEIQNMIRSQREPILFKKNEAKFDCPDGWEPIIEEYGDVCALYGYRKKHV